MVIWPEDRKYFEEMGELYVRRAMRLNDRFPFRNSAREWLAELDETQRQMREGRARLRWWRSNLKGRLGQHGLQRSR